MAIGALVKTASKTPQKLPVRKTIKKGDHAGSKISARSTKTLDNKTTIETRKLTGKDGSSTSQFKDAKGQWQNKYTVDGDKKTYHADYTDKSRAGRAKNDVKAQKHDDRKKTEHASAPGSTGKDADKPTVPGPNDTVDAPEKSFMGKAWDAVKENPMNTAMLGLMAFPLIQPMLSGGSDK